MKYEGCKDIEGIHIEPSPEPAPGECDCDKINSDIADLQDNKQDKLTAGQNIIITDDNVISSTGGGTSYIAGENINITNNVISAPNVYSKSEVNSLLDAIEIGEFVIVDELPSAGEAKNIYLVPRESGGYTEWLYVTSGWEEIGDTDIDLSGYYTSSQVDTLLEDKQNNLTAGENISISFDGVISAEDTTYGVATPTSNGLMSTEDKEKLDELKTYSAGSHITISNDGKISATMATKEELLAILGYNDHVISMTDDSDKEIVLHVLGWIEEKRNYQYNWGFFETNSILVSVKTSPTPAKSEELYEHQDVYFSIGEGKFDFITSNPDYGMDSFSFQFSEQKLNGQLALDSTSYNYYCLFEIGDNTHSVRLKTEFSLHEELYECHLSIMMIDGMSTSDDLGFDAIGYLTADALSVAVKS